MDDNINDIDVPEDLLVRGGPMRDIMCDRVPPRREAAIGTQVLAVASLELDLIPIPNRLPFNGRVQTSGHGLKNLATSHSDEERVVGSC